MTIKTTIEDYNEWKAAQKKKARQDAEREAYKQLVDEAIAEIFPVLQCASAELTATKTSVYSRFETARKIKEELYSVKEDQRSHTFTSADGRYRIILGNHQMDDYDDTVNEGVAKVKQVITSFASDNNSKLLVEAIMKLLSKDQKGNLKASRVMQLRKLANDSGNAELIDGVQIIENAYRPAVSKEFVRAEYKNEKSMWVSVPLGMTEA